MKKVLVISSSLRNQSTSRKLALEMIRGIKENNQVDFIDLINLNFSFCHGCLSCQNTGKCILDDDIKKVIDKVNDSNILVFVTPIYYYSISGQLKTFLDRMNPLFNSKKRKFSDIYALFTCADDSDEAFIKPITTLEGWIECFDNVKLIDVFKGNSLTSIYDLNNEVLQKAYKFGKEIK